MVGGRVVDSTGADDRTAGGPVPRETIAEMDIFTRAVEVEALRLAQKSGKHPLSRSDDILFQWSHVERAEQERVEQKLLLKRLKPVEAGHHLNRGCMEGTCQSVFNRILDWATDTQGVNDAPRRNTYWLYGSPGIGKTALAHSICAGLHEGNHLAGAFFCRRDDPNLSETRSILPTLIYKLATIFPPFRNVDAQRLRNDPNVAPESMKGSLFLEFIRSLPRHPKYTLVFVIDALDECGNAQSRPGILRALNEAAAQAPWLKMIITSRPEADIQRSFNALTTSSYLQYDLATDKGASTDLRAFAQSQFDLVAQSWYLPSPWPE